MDSVLKTMTKIHTTDQLGLAAYMATQGCTLMRTEGRSFVLSAPAEKNSERELSEWECDYAGSDAARFNATLVAFQNLRRNSK